MKFKILTLVAWCAGSLLCFLVAFGICRNLLHAVAGTCLFVLCFAGMNVLAMRSRRWKKLSELRRRVLSTPRMASRLLLFGAVCDDEEENVADWRSEFLSAGDAFELLRCRHSYLADGAEILFLAEETEARCRDVTALYFAGLHPSQIPGYAKWKRFLLEYALPLTAISPIGLNMCRVPAKDVSSKTVREFCEIRGYRFLSR